MNIGTRLLAGCAALLTGFQASGAVTISLDRAGALYKTGEPAVFTVNPDTAAPAIPLKAELTLDGGKVLSTQELSSDKGGRITGTLSEPGVLQLRLTGKRNGKSLRVLSGAAFSPEKITPGADAPEDFNAFWKAELAKAESVPLDPKLTKLDRFSNEKYTSYEVSFAVPEGRVYGYLCIPCRKEAMPALIGIEPSGSGRNTPVVNQFGNRCVVLWLNVHNFSPSLPEPQRSQAYRAVNTPVLYRFANNTDREKYYFHRCLLGFSRAVDYLASRPEVSPGKIGIFGTSQGGGLGLMLTALNPKIKGVCVSRPAMCDRQAYRQNRLPGWPRANRAPDAAEEKCAQYYDTVNFCRSIKVPVWIISGLADDTCPPSGNAAAFNVIPATRKTLIFEPGTGHSSSLPNYGNAIGKMLSTLQSSSK